MKWNEITIITNTIASDAISEMLINKGSAGVSIEDPQDILHEINKSDSLDYADPSFLENLGEDVTLRAYFPEIQSIGELIPILTEKLSEIREFMDIGKGSINHSSIDEEDWANSWKKYYNTFSITPNIIIRPSWQEAQIEDNKIIIELDPGMAFGTGTHETTSMCANLLETHMTQGSTVYDLGTGSGILAIIASRLGAKSVLGMDIDEVAVRVANENVIINKVQENVNITKGIIDDYVGPKFDIIIANIIARVIIDLADDVHKNLKPGGLFITSGIIKDRKEDVLMKYSELGFKVVKISELGEWVAIVFLCQDSL